MKFVIKKFNIVFRVLMIYVIGFFSYPILKNNIPTAKKYLDTVVEKRVFSYKEASVFLKEELSFCVAGYQKILETLGECEVILDDCVSLEKKKKRRRKKKKKH